MGKWTFFFPLFPINMPGLFLLFILLSCNYLLFFHSNYPFYVTHIVPLFSLFFCLLILSFLPPFYPSPQSPDSILPSLCIMSTMLHSLTHPLWLLCPPSFPSSLPWSLSCRHDYFLLRWEAKTPEIITAKACLDVLSALTYKINLKSAEIFNYLQNTTHTGACRQIGACTRSKAKPSDRL